MAERVCEGCGCTDKRPCFDRAGLPCSWLEDYPGDLCSMCAEIAEAVLAAPDEDGGAL